MKKLLDNFLIWLAKILQPIVEKKFILKDTWELEKVENKGIKLPYVLFDNNSTVINNFLIPVKLVRMRFQLYNKGASVGRILFDGPVKISPRSKKSISMEVRLNHMTALFNMLRFVFTTTNIQMELKGEVQIKLLGLDFFIPVTDVLDLPKSKVQMIIKSIEKNSHISTIPFVEVENNTKDIISVQNLNESSIAINNESEENFSEKEVTIETIVLSQESTTSTSDERNPL